MDEKENKKNEDYFKVPKVALVGAFILIAFLALVITNYNTQSCSTNLGILKNEMDRTISEKNSRITEMQDTERSITAVIDCQNRRTNSLLTSCSTRSINELDDPRLCAEAVESFRSNNDCETLYSN